MDAILLALMIAQTPVEGGSVKPTLTIPAQVQAQPMKPFTIKCESNCKWIRWTIPPGLERIDPKDTAYGDKGFVGFGSAGVYEFVIEGSLNDVHVDAKCVVFVGQPIPPGPGPGPGPGPKPPIPKPNDPLFPELQRLYDADGNIKKADYLANLIGVYDYAARMAKKDMDIKTTKELFAHVRRVASTEVEDNLKTLREKLREVCIEFDAVEQPLDANLRARAAACFERCSALLRGLK